MKKIIMTIVSIVSIISMANIFSSEERTKLLDKESYKKGTFELINENIFQWEWVISLKNGNEIIISEKDKQNDKKMSATINILLPTKLTLYKKVDDKTVIGQYELGSKLEEVGSYTFPTGKDIKVILFGNDKLKPQKGFKRLLSKNKNVTQDDITFTKNKNYTPQKEETVAVSSEEAVRWAWK